jgi:hypothetical protein
VPGGFGLPLDHDNHQGNYGEAFVRIVAAAAGLAVAKPDPDYDGIDFFLRYPRAAFIGHDHTSDYIRRLPPDVFIGDDERLVVLPRIMLVAAKPDIPDD